MESFQGKVNITNFLLGIIVIICGIVIYKLQSHFAMISNYGVAIIVAGFVLGPMIVYGAFSNRNNQVFITKESICLNEQSVYWKDLQSIKEIVEKRYMKLLGKNILLRKVRTLKFSAAISISDQWLGKADYERLYEKVAAIIPIESEIENNIS